MIQSKSTWTRLRLTRVIGRDVPARLARIPPTVLSTIDPNPVGNLDGLSFAMRFRRTPIEISLEVRKLTVAVQDDGLDRPIKVGVGDEERKLRPGEGHTFGAGKP